MIQLLKVKVILCVIICNSCDYLLESLVVLGIFALVNPLTDNVTHNTSEVFVSGVGNKGTAIRKHTNEVGKRTEVSKSHHLCFHAVSLVVKPPAGAELDLAGNCRILEASEHCAENVVILGVKSVENGSGKNARLLKVIHKRTESLCDAKVVDGVVAGVGTELVIHLSVVVTESTDVKLHSPTELGVLLSASFEHCGLECIYLFLGKLTACHSFIESSLCVANTEGHVFKGVVGKTAAEAVKVCDSLLDPLNKLLIALNADHLNVGNKGLLANLNSLVGTEGGKDLGGEALHLCVILKGVCGIVGGADNLNVRASDKSLGAELGLCKALIALVPNHLAGFFVERLVNVEISFKLEVSPMVKGVADKLRHNACESLELLVFVSAACNVFLVNDV